jgi:hypothetical protein
MTEKHCKQGLLSGKKSGQHKRQKKPKLQITAPLAETLTGLCGPASSDKAAD